MSVKAAALCIQGFEDTTAKELVSLGAKNYVEKRGTVLFEVENYEKLARIAYMIRTASRVFSVLFKKNIGQDLDAKTESITKEIQKIDFSKWLEEDNTFKVEVMRVGEHYFSSADFEALLGKIIIESIEEKKGYKQKVEMDNPDLKIFASIIHEQLIVGIDFSGFDLSKREHHIFTNKTSIKGTVASNMLFFADIKKNDVILDPNCGCGMIPIEAAIMSKGESPHIFRKEEFIFKKLKPLSKTNFEKLFETSKQKRLGLKMYAYDGLLANVKATQKNAKIANIEKEIIDFSRIEFDWIDTKFDEKSVDKIITKLPSPSKLKPLKEIEKIQNEVFHQADYVLKKGGVLAILIKDDTPLISISKKYKFKLVDNKDIMIGKMPAKAIKLQKK